MYVCNYQNLGLMLPGSITQQADCANESLPLVSSEVHEKGIVLLHQLKVGNLVTINNYTKDQMKVMSDFGLQLMDATTEVIQNVVRECLEMMPQMVHKVNHPRQMRFTDAYKTSKTKMSARIRDYMLSNILNRFEGKDQDCARVALG